MWGCCACPRWWGCWWSGFFSARTRWGGWDIIGIIRGSLALGPHALGWLDDSLLEIGGDLRLIALIVILLRAGFQISRRALHRVGGRALLLSFVPAACEGAAITLIAPFLLDLTLLESALLGSVLAAVSPAVVVPAMIRFIERGKGADKDIPSLVLAGASLDDVFVIVVHGVLVSAYVGGEAGVAWRFAGIPLSLVLGAAAGLGIGMAMCRLFDRFNPRATKRVLTLIAVSVLLVRLQHLLAGTVPFAAFVATMAIGFIILEKREHYAHEISARLAKVWVFAEIILFSMVSAQVNIQVAWRAGAAGAAVVALGVLSRGAGTWLCMLRSTLTLPERAFVAVAYTPKATVQAAIAAAPLAAMRAAGMDRGPGEVILAVGVLSILLTAPAGAWAIEWLGEKVLKQSVGLGNDAKEAAEESGGAEEAL